MLKRKRPRQAVSWSWSKRSQALDIRGCPLSADWSGTETAQPQNEILCSKGAWGRCPGQASGEENHKGIFLLCRPVCINTGIACLFSSKMKRVSERIVKFHSLAQFVSNFSDNSVSSLFFRASRIFCPKAVKSSIGIIVHLNNIVSFRFI